MRKTIAVILAALMIFAAVGAYAAGAKSPQGVCSGFTNAMGVELANVEPHERLLKLIQYIIEACVNDRPVDRLPEDIAKLVDEARESIKEIGCWQLGGDLNALNSIELTFKFASPYMEGTELTLLICTETNDGFAWLTAPGVVNDDRNVMCELTQKDLEIIANKQFVIIVIEENMK